MIDERTEGHSVTLLADGRVLVAGNGRRDARSAELFDPATGSWTAAADMLSGRYDHAATLLADGRVLVTGGREGVVEEEGIASAELYDPSTDAWTITGSMRQPRWGHSAALLADGRVLVVGGYGSVSDGDGGGSSRSLSSAELFDPETGSWSAAASPVSWTMGDHTAVRLLDDTVLVAGQRGAEIYLPEDDRWVPTAEMVGSGDSREAVVLLDGRVLVTGSQFYLQIGQSELYDPDTGNWTPTGDMNEPRSWFTATRLPDGRVLAAGGGDGGYGGYATAELYDPVSGTWSPTHDMLAPRGWHEAIALADGRVLVVGGFGGLGSGPDAEIFDPSVGP